MLYCCPRPSVKPVKPPPLVQTTMRDRSRPELLSSHKDNMASQASSGLSGSEGSSRGFVVAKQRLANAQKQASSAAKMMHATQSLLHSSQREIHEVEKLLNETEDFMKMVEERWEEVMMNGAVVDSDEYGGDYDEDKENENPKTQPRRRTAGRNKQGNNTEQLLQSRSIIGITNNAAVVDHVNFQGAAMSELNGTYTRIIGRHHGGAPMFTKRGRWSGKMVDLIMFRQHRFWYIGLWSGDVTDANCSVGGVKAYLQTIRWDEDICSPVNGDLFRKNPAVYV